EGAHLLAGGDALLDRGVDRPIVDQRPAWVIDEVDAVKVARAELAYLARPAGDRVLVALAAGLRVKDRPQPVRDLLLLAEVVHIRVEVGLRDKAVGLVVKARGGFDRGERDHALRLRGDHRVLEAGIARVVGPGPGIAASAEEEYPRQRQPEEREAESPVH